MKKIRNYFVVCAVALFCIAGMSSCGSDDEDEPVDAASIIGTWQAVYEEVVEKENGKVVEQESGDWEGEIWIFDFRADGTYAMYDDDTNEYEHLGTWKLDGKKLVMKQDGETDPDEWYHYTVENISGNNLVLSQYEKGTDEEGTWELYCKITFKKIK